MIGYATPGATLRPASLGRARAALAVACVPSAVGLAILLGYRLTAWRGLVDAGLAWLMLGGGLALGSLILAVVGLSFARAAAENGPRARRLYWLAGAAALASVPVAFGCVVVGMRWESASKFTLAVANDTPTPLASVTVHLDGGDRTLGPIAPGATASRYVWTDHYGPLSITVRAAGQSKRTVDRVSASGHNFKHDAPGGVYTLRVEPTEVP